MKDRLRNVTAAVVLFAWATTLNSCAAIEGIFKAGVWTGIFIVVIIIALIIWIISRARK